MDDPTAEVVHGYQRHGARDRVLEAVSALFPDSDEPVGVDDLAPVDEFHIRGRESTVELADLAEVEPGTKVLDVGCGLGGSARYLATRFGAEVVGVDPAPDFLALARTLSERTGCDEEVSFREGSAGALPVEDGAFDVVWMEHVQMNVADKAALADELRRALRPGGVLAFHEIFAAGTDDDLHFPVPWADGPAASFLEPAHAFQERLAGAGFGEKVWRDVTAPSLAWFEATIERLEGEGPPPLGLHLLMGEAAPVKLKNVGRNLSESRIRVFQGVYTR